MAEGEAGSGDYEHSDVPPWLPAALAAGLIVATTLVGAAIWLSFGQINDDRAKSPLRPLPPAPQLQTDPKADLMALQAQAARRLHSYGWVDRAHGRIHMPIEAAMAGIAGAAPGTPDSGGGH